MWRVFTDHITFYIIGNSVKKKTWQVIHVCPWNSALKGVFCFCFYFLFYFILFFLGGGGEGQGIVVFGILHHRISGSQSLSWHQFETNLWFQIMKSWIPAFNFKSTLASPLIFQNHHYSKKLLPWRSLVHLVLWI